MALRSRGIVRTGRIVTIWLIAALVCPAFGEIGTLTSKTPCSSAHACCRRSAASGACPHQMSEGTHEGRCHASVCVLTCGSRQDTAVAPVIVIGFFPTSAFQDADVVVARLGIVSSSGRGSFIALPSTPPPRTA